MEIHGVPVENLGSRAVIVPSVAAAFQALLTKRIMPTSAGSSSLAATAVSTSWHGCTLAPASIQRREFTEERLCAACLYCGMSNEAAVYLKACLAIVSCLWNQQSKKVPGDQRCVTFKFEIICNII